MLFPLAIDLSFLRLARPYLSNKISRGILRDNSGCRIYRKWFPKQQAN